MLGDYGEVYVVDWGVATLTTPDDVSIDGEQNTGIVGTLGFLAPEQARAGTPIGPTADVYSLGAVLFELLTLTPLHEGGGAVVLAQTLGGVDARASVRCPEQEVPPELEAICVRATMRDPAERFADARALHDAIDDYLKGERDELLRRDAALGHVGRARELLGSAGTHASATTDARRSALSELGRALSLDPDNPDAARMLAALFTDTPDETPLEVQQALEASARQQQQKIAKVSATAYASLALFVPVVWSLGVLSPWPLIVFFGLAAGCTALSVWAILRPRSTMVVVALMLMSTAMFVCLWRMYGPLLVLPPALVSNAVGFTMLLRGRWRVMTIVVSAAALVAPVLLEVLGVVSPSYQFVDGTIHVLPHLVELNETSSTLMLTLAGLSSLLIACLAAGVARSQLAAAELKLYLFHWQVRALIPGAEVRPDA